MSFKTCTPRQNWTEKKYVSAVKYVNLSRFVYTLHFQWRNYPPIRPQWDLGGQKIVGVFIFSQSKNMKSDITRCIFWAPKCTKIRFRPRLRLGLHWESSPLSPDLLAAFRGLLVMKGSVGERDRKEDQGTVGKNRQEIWAKLTKRAKAYSSSCSQVILVYLHPFRRNSLFCSQKSPKNHVKSIFLRFKVIQGYRYWHS